MNLKQSHLHPRRTLALLLTLVMCMGMVPTAFAAQQNSYHAPAEHWLTASNRTNELDVNAVVTHETLLRRLQQTDFVHCVARPGIHQRWQNGADPQCDLF